MASSIPRSSPSTDGIQTCIGSDPVFDEATAKFKKRLTKSQAQMFANCTLEDVKHQIRDIQTCHGSQKRSRNMERLSKFVEGMIQLGKALEVFLNLDNAVALIWGPLKFLLLTASTWIDTLDSLLDVYAQIGEVLPDLTRYPQVYSEYPSVHTHLESYYCDILQFHSNALEVFARRGWKVLFHSAWKTFKTQFDPILKSLQRHRDMLSEAKLTAVMQEIQKQGQSVEDGLHQLNRKLEDEYKRNTDRDLIAHQGRIDQQISTVESRIDAPSYHEDYEIASRKRYQSTSGSWILGHPLVSEWLNHSSSSDGKIYLSGIPGAGKTVLTSSIIRYLKEQQLSAKDSVDRFLVSYFYFKHHQPKKRSLVSLLLALLAQLASQDETLLDHVYQTCRSTEQQQFRSLDEVSCHVETALRSHSRCFVIIDGLDECSESFDVLQWFSRIMTKQSGASTDANSNIRLFISGQRDGILETQMSDFKRIDLETSFGHGQDIKTFATTEARKIRERFSLDSDVEQEIILRVTSQAGGMFLYAQLVLSNLLDQISKYDLEEEMKTETFPEGLEQAYDRVIVRVLRNPKKTTRVAAKHILGMIVCACRRLHWREIQSKFCIDAREGEANIARKLVTSCKEICSSLVDVSYLEPSLASPGEEIIDLVHDSAKIYLVQTKEIDIQTENAKMALFCTEYMTSRPLTPGLSKLEIQESTIKGYDGFHDYAVAFWWKHVQQVLAASGLDIDLAQRIFQAAHRCLIDTGEIDETEYSNNSAGTIQSLRRKLQAVPQNLRDWHSIRVYELRVIAVRNVIEELVKNSNECKEVTLPFQVPWRYKCHKPWCQFFNSGFDEVQQQKRHINQHEFPFTCEYEGCFATKLGFENETALKNHTRKWHPRKELPLFPTVKRHNEGHDGDKVQSNIMKAARTGDLNTIRDMIEKGDISPDYHIGTKRSLLHTAVVNGQLQICQYLIEKGADFNPKIWQKPWRGSILDVAINCADFEIVAFLCSRKDIHLSRGQYRSLHRCVDNVPFSQPMMRQLLLRANLKDLQDVLFYAIKVRHETAVAFLADNIEASCFEKSLCVAAETSNLPCLDALLLSGKTDPNVRDTARELPLHAACASAALPFFQRLYAVTTTTDNKDATGNTFLHLACEGGNYEVVKFLIEEGEDVNAQNRHGDTPLNLAEQKNYRSVERLLLYNGGMRRTIGVN